MTTDIDLSGLDEFQVLHHFWAAKNFGETPSYRPLLGAVEELGELAHAHLKGEQGIRHTPVEIIEKKMDAIGDVLVYLSDYANREGLKLSDCLHLAWNEIKDRDWITYPETGRPPKGSAEAIVDEAISLPDVPQPVTLGDVLASHAPIKDYPPGPADGGESREHLEELAVAALAPRAAGADLRPDGEPKYPEGAGPPTIRPDFVTQGDDAEDNRDLVEGC